LTDQLPAQPLTLQLQNSFRQFRAAFRYSAKLQRTLCCTPLTNFQAVALLTEKLQLITKVFLLSSKGSLVFYHSVQNNV
jgi:hypothetical protein